MSEDDEKRIKRYLDLLQEVIGADADDEEEERPRKYTLNFVLKLA